MATIFDAILLAGPREMIGDSWLATHHPYFFPASSSLPATMHKPFAGPKVDRLAKIPSRRDSIPSLSE